MRIKIIFIIAIFVIICNIFGNAINISADEAYDVYNYDRWGEPIPSQAGYTAYKNVSGDDLGIGHFSNLSDIARDKEDNFYLVDADNNRIVIINSEFDKVVRILNEFNYKGKKTTLNKPKGIFVSSDDDKIYIADTENSRIVKCDTEGNVDLIIEKPSNDLYKKDQTFLPQKIIVDKAGYIYCALGNITGGAVMFKANGDFEGFYGANRSNASPVQYFFKLIATEEMRKYMKNSVPAPITSFDIDEEGFIYTCSSSQTQEIDTVKKLNAAGYNLFDGNEAIFGDIGTLYSANKTYRTSIVDIEISDDNLINCLDYTSGRIFQYDEDCNLLFIIGSIGEQLGGFKQVSGIESNNDYLYVTDSQKNTVTVFKKTVFGSIVHEATRLYNDGYYDEALEPWYEVLKRDGNYRRAYIGISSALINQGDYKSAMKYAKLAKSQRIYDRAFEGYRTEVINNNFTLISVIILITIVSLIIILVLKKKSIIIKNINSEKGGD